MRMRKEVVVCVQYVVGRKKFLFHFEDGQQRYMGSCLLMYVCSEEYFCRDLDKSVSDFLKKKLNC